MLTERALVPYSTTTLDLTPILVFAPHPDDEVFGMGGTLLLAREAGVSIKIVYVTAGEKGGDAPTRMHEAESACHLLNADFQFLNFVDREVQVTSTSIKLFSEVIKEHADSHIYFPSPLEFHPDHRAIAALVWRGAQEAQHKLPMFSYEISRQSEVNTLVDISTVSDKKNSLMALYKSQLTQNNYIDVMTALAKARTYTLGDGVAFAEGFYRFENCKGSLRKRFQNIIHGSFDDILPFERPTISILIRTLNRPEYLERALTSVANQNYSQFIEVVVINDGGEPVDEVTEAFRLTFKSLKIINLPRSMGRAAAANAGLINSSGLFLNFLDDDDEFRSNHISTFLDAWRRNNDIDVLYRGVEVVSAEGETIRIYNDAYDPGRLAHANYIPIHAITFSRKFVELGCRFDESLQYMEDWDFWIQLSRLTIFHHVPVVTATYHKVGTSVVSPQQQGVLDQVNHTNRVLDKWNGRWSAVERNRTVNAMIARHKKVAN